MALFLTSLLVLVPTALVVGLVFLVHPRAPEGGWLRGMEDAGEIFSAVATGLAVLVAFLIVATFDSYHSGREAVGEEAVAVQQEYAMSSFFDEEFINRLHGEVICYTRAVVEDEWPAMQRGEESAVVQGWVDQMDESMRAVPVNDPKQVEALAHLFDVSNDRQDGRRGRLAEAAPFVPGFLWAALGLLSVVVIGYQFLLLDRKVPVRGQAYGMAAMTLTILAALAVIWIIDRPFNDRGAMVPPTRLESALALMSRTAPDPVPCDLDGNPV
jgi:Protein of unknown function (DUF4239)